MKDKDAETDLTAVPEQQPWWVGLMVFQLIEDKARKERDKAELRMLQRRFGETVIEELERRASSAGLSARSKRHWVRLLKMARRDRKPGLAGSREITS